MKQLQVSIGELVHRCRGGDINFRFSSKSTAIEGIRGHQAVQRRRRADYPDTYIAEQVVAHSMQAAGIELDISGRVDGYGWVDGQFVVDEIKTLRIHHEDIPPDVLATFWHQARLYAYLVARLESQPAVTVRLCLYHLDDKEETILTEMLDIEALQQVFIDSALHICEQVRALEDWRNQRDERIAGMRFPYDEFRPGQRDMAVAVYRAVTSGGQLVMQAPTGIGKTMGVLFPAIQAIPQRPEGKVFYASARTSIQQMAETAAADINADGATVRSITIKAKEKACFTPGAPCHPEHCQYAAGYYDRLDNAVADTWASASQLTPEAISEKALEHDVCPFEFSLDLAREADLIISDYNYIFDPVVQLQRFFSDSGVPHTVLVDEAHNLPERARDMFSATISKEDYLQASKTLADELPLIAKRAAAVNRAILDLKRPEADAYKTSGFLAFKEAPERVLAALAGFNEAAEEELRLERGGPQQELLLQLYFDALRFTRTAETYGDDYVTLLRNVGRKNLLSLFCVDPSVKLSMNFDKLAAGVCFSATMRPKRFFDDQLGMTREADWYRLASPFPQENLAVINASHISTTFRDRQASASELAELIRTVTSARSGNYIVFFPSYRYMQDVYDIYTARYGDTDLLLQTRDMDDEGREAYLEAFVPGENPLTGFAVMGGSFSEGIDLKGEALIGVVVVGVGLPQIGIERDLIANHFEEREQGAGFAYAYQYPGITKVLQTAGRVIRDENDRGVVCLVDRRFSQHAYRGLLPDDWAPSSATSNEEVAGLLSSFWND